MARYRFWELIERNLVSGVSHPCPLSPYALLFTARDIYAVKLFTDD